MILLINIHYLDISNIIYNILYKSMNKCVSVFDFLCHPVKNFLNKCFGKTKPTVQQNNSKKIVVEEIKQDIQTNNKSNEEITQAREIFINTNIPSSEFDKPKDIPALKLKKLIKKDSLSNFVNNNYLNADFNNKQNYGSDTSNEVRVNND